ncbi:MAG: DUF5106 domain-containing protein [Bacteroidota bacterium]|nr:DUF5106 domain-containing protein [Bacteroidota bacterium]
MRKLSTIILFSFISYTLSYAQGYEIKIKFNAKNDTVMLGHHRATSLVPDDTVVTNKEGYAVLTGKNKLPGGMYFLFFSNKKYFDFLIGDNQTFSISGDTSDFSNIIYKGDKQNILFSFYQKKMNTMGSQIREMYEKRKTLNKGDQAQLDKKIAKKRNELEMLYDKTVSENEGLFFTTFLKATKQVTVPPEITDRQKQYEYFKKHYFDNFDYGDDRLMRTPIYEDRLMTYLDKLVVPDADSIISEVDKFIESARDNDEHFKYILIHLFNKYVSSQRMIDENVYIHIAEKYYIPEAEWSSPKFISDLKEKVKKQKKCLIGAKAFDINYNKLSDDTLEIKKTIKRNDFYKDRGLAIEKTDTTETAEPKKAGILKKWITEYKASENMYSTKSKYTILWFWTPDCSHCRKATPKFYDLYLEKKLKEKGVEVLAIYSNEGISDWKKFSDEQKKWLKFVKKHNLTQWTNAWNPFDLFRQNYNISSSPVLFVLDENYKILAKKIEYTQALELIEHELKFKNEQ